MKKVPCEDAVWEILPAIRRELAISLVKERALSQREAAKILGLTEAAVSQYISSKRGGKLDLPPEVMPEIKRAADIIILNEARTTHELCRICTLVQHYSTCSQSRIIGVEERKKKGK
ncbi:MAG: transcriptional regulator [Thermoplasmata archaeon]|nr:transcriptional regulator [Thermoplasmata archaeon]